MAMYWRAILLLLLAPLWAAQVLAKPAAVDRSYVFDSPGDENDLNREIWQQSGRGHYERLLALLKRRQQSTPRATSLPLPNGWQLAPAGKQVDVGRLPYEALIYQDRLVVMNSGYTGKEPQTVSVINPGTGVLERTIPMPALYPSGAVGRDGDLYLSGGFSREVVRLDRQFQPSRRYPLAGYVGPVAALDASHLVVGYLVAPLRQTTSDGVGRVVVLNTLTGKVEAESSGLLFPTSIHVLSGKIYVTALGDQRVHSFDRQLHPLHQLTVGAIPQTSCTDGQHLYVLSSGSDTLSTLNTTTDTLLASIDLRVKGFRFGSSPTACAVDGERLYVSQAEINALGVFDLSSGRQLGSIPTGWYPTKVLSHGPWLISLSAKGIRPRRPNPQGPTGDQYVLALLKGTAGILVKAEISKELTNWTALVEHGNPLVQPSTGFQLPIRHIFYIIKENRTYDQVLGDLKPGNGDQNLAIFGSSITPHHHQIAQQFVTLDNTFVNGEISVLGHSFTTSGYASPFLELIGNLSYTGRFSGYPFGMVPATFSPTYLWNALDAKGVGYRIYGEPYYLYTRVYQILCNRYGCQSPLTRRFYAHTMALANQNDRGRAFSERLRKLEPQQPTVAAIEGLLQREDARVLLSEVFTGDRNLAYALAGDSVLRQQFASFLSHYAFSYRPYDLTYSDLLRAQDWKQDFQRQLNAGNVAALSYIWLPNDHTGGANPKLFTPAQYLAQNDAALGEIVTTISRSSVWKDSLILVIEDDAQNGPDHVDATRTVALAAGPYIKRGVVVSDRYDQLSLIRTIGLILGLPPLNMGEGLAAPMFGIFSKQPDFSPYQPVPASSQLHPTDRELVGVKQSGD